jgi:cyclic dehypoxanthinyl futalosine synthase
MHAKIRVACVGYTNAWPLTRYLDPALFTVEACVPSVAARRLNQGQADVGLVPVASLFDKGASWRVAPGWCIGSDGDVDSVLLVGERPLEEWEEVVLDGESRTSVILAQILLRGPLGRPDIPVRPVDAGTGAFHAQGTVGAVVIGDAARNLPARLGTRIDLGRVWRDWTGLPFVFAVWAGRPDLPFAAIEGLRAAGERGMPDRALAPEPERDYLTRAIRYALDDRALMGLRRFVALGQSAGLLGPGELSLYPPPAQAARSAAPPELLTRAARGESLSDLDMHALALGAPTGELAAGADEVRWRRSPAREVTWLPAGNLTLDNLPSRVAVLTAGKALAAILQPGPAGEQTLGRSEAAIRTLKGEHGLSVTGLGADELLGMAIAAGASPEAAIARLVAAGLDGFGGAPTRAGAVARPTWQAMQRLAGAHGLRGPATLTLGLGETRAERVDHLLALRAFQAGELEAGRPGFTALSVWTALSGEPDRDDSAQAWLRTIALARLVLDNIPHITAWWPSVGLGSAQAALFAGADDLGPALLDEAAIGAPGRSFTTDGDEVEHHIRVAGFVPVRRDLDWTTLTRIPAAPEGRYARF